MVMGEMGVAESAIGHGQGEGGEGQRFIRAAGPEGVAVQNLMLERRELRDGEAGQDDAKKGTEIIDLRRSECPEPIGGDHDKKGWPFDGRVVVAQSGAP